MNDDIAIKIEHVSKDFRLVHGKSTTIKSKFTSMLKGEKASTTAKQHALNDVSFEIKKGEFFGIVGRNGSGKSTLLKILASIYQPTTGAVKTVGKLVPFIELGVGFNPELTGRENVYLNGAILGFSKKEVDSFYDDVVEFAELDEYMDKKLKNYSSGMQVRLAFSVAIRANADILLIDEVLAVGDADFQRKCFNYFDQLHHKDTTVIFVSHDMTAIREYCDRAMLIEGSELVAIGDTNEVTEKYLQLFIEHDRDEIIVQNKNEDRWGDQSVVITKVSASSAPDNITVLLDFKSKKFFKAPIAGFRIRDAAGEDVTGTNTKKEGVTIPDQEKGQSTHIEWKMPNVLRDGKYVIDIAIQYPDEITVADWWNGAAVFTIKKKRHLPYVIDPGFETIVR